MLKKYERDWSPFEHIPFARKVSPYEQALSNDNQILSCSTTKKQQNL